MVAGCGSEYTFAPVSGKITIDGQPGANCYVEFSPIGDAEKPTPGPASSGISDAQGGFTLKSVPDEFKGAVVTKHRVRILVREDEAKTQVDNNRAEDPDNLLKDALAQKRGRAKTAFKQLPAKFNVQTELTFDVPAAGTEQANFDLKTK